jgi:hypothetical protein
VIFKILLLYDTSSWNQLPGFSWHPTGISLSNAIVTGEIIIGVSQIATSGTTKVNNPEP